MSDKTSGSSKSDKFNKKFESTSNIIILEIFSLLLVIVKAFKQQRLPSWKPVLTCGTVLPTFFLISVLLLVCGSGLLYLSTQVHEFQLDYTNCWPLFGTRSCAQALDDDPTTTGCKCWYKFELSEDFSSSVYVYYGLKNYYQNHRLYENSFDESQLMGKIQASIAINENYYIDNHQNVNGFQASTACEPFRYKEVSGGRRLPIVPCGTIANSLFNDSFRIWRHDMAPNWAQEVPLLYTGISWPSDQYFFKNPQGVPLQVAYTNFTNPPYWRRYIWQLDPNNPDNNGMKNEALIVWFRTAAFPEFRKLYARVNHVMGSVYENSLPNGHYFLEIDYSEMRNNSS